VNVLVAIRWETSAGESLVELFNDFINVKKQKGIECVSRTPACVVAVRCGGFLTKVF
jgi:hypothetical protein